MIYNELEDKAPQSTSSVSLIFKVLVPMDVLVFVYMAVLVLVSVWPSWLLSKLHE